MTETDAEFVLRARDCYGSLTGQERDRLFEIADRGAAMQWRKITESDPVPRDGSSFAICVEGEPDSTECGWYNPYIMFDYEEVEGGLYQKIGRLACEWSGFSNMHRATHWMPLPAPPEGEKGKAAGEGGKG